jgi:raffinose/stachyose/melibiose transport system permease protein
MRTSITVVLVLSLIQSLKAFDIVYGMTLGGPAQSTQMLALWAFTQSMQIHDFGKGSAVAVVLLLITIAIVVPYMAWRGKSEEARP